MIALMHPIKGDKMKKKIIRIGLVIISLLFVGIFIKRSVVGTDFEALNQDDQEMLKRISKIYEETEEDNSRTGEISLIVTPVADKLISNTSYLVGRPKLSYSIFAKSIKVPKDLNLPGVYQIGYISKSFLWTWFTAHFTFVDVGLDYTFLYKIG